MAHKNVIIIYKINSTDLVVAGMTKWLNDGPKMDNTNNHCVHSECTKEP